MKIPTDCAENLAVTMCGGRLKPHVVDGGCDTIRFEGIEDATVNQGAGIDLRDGITAYDGDGNEIEYEVEPSELAPCEVGEFDIEYRASGKGLTMKPTVCGRNKVHAIDCGLDTVVEHRLVTVTQADPPTISGVGETVIGENTDFNPLDGVSAVDDNGNVLEVEYSGKYLEEANGGIATFESEYEDPMHSLKVSLEPIQDLHGYDKPWVGGAGTNQWDEEWESGAINGANGGTYTDSTKIRSKNYISVLPNTDYYVKMPYAFNYAWYDAEKRYISGDSSATPNYTRRSPNNARYLKFSIVGTTYNNDIAINYPPTVTTYSPYSNICPISGRTEVVTQRTGKNLFSADKGDENLSSTYGMQKVLSNDVDAFLSFTPKVSNPSLPNNTSFGFVLDPTRVNDGFQWTLSNGQVQTGGKYGKNQTVNGSAPVGTLCKYVFWYPKGALPTILTQYDIQLELGSTATDYEPYQGASYTTTLGRTVYGGTLDVVSGELTETKLIAELDGSSDESWTLQSINSHGIANFFYRLNNATDAGGAVCNEFNRQYSLISVTTDEGFLINANSVFYVRIDSTKASTVSDFKSWLASNPLQLVYPLATPQTYQLTPTEVRTLLGQNNVWSDGIYHPLVKRYLKDNSWTAQSLNGVTYYVNQGYGYMTTEPFASASMSCSHFKVTRNVEMPTSTSTPLADNGVYLTDNGRLLVRYDAIEGADTNVSLQNWLNFITSNNVFLTVPSYGDTASDSLDLTLQYNAQIPQGEAYKYIAQGTYTVTYRAVDQCGNETEVVRNITVGENIPVRRTVLRQDGTLVINELASEYYANNEIYGAIVKEFEPYDEDNRYIFDLNNLPPWYADKNSITNVAVGEHIYPTQLDLWFYGLSNAETWELARLHTENATSMHRAFASAKVENLHLDQLDTSNVTDFSYMFNGARSTQPVIPSLMDTSKGENFGSMFDSANFDMLDTVGMDVSNALIMASMFANCGNLTDLDLSSFIPLKCTDFSRMFYNCFRLQHLNLLNFHTPSAVLMNHMFGSNRAYQELDLSAFDTSNVTNMSGMFLNTTVAEPVVGFLNFDTSKVEDFSNMFTQALVGGGNDHYLDLSTWDTSSAINMSQMFVAASIGILNIANFTTPNVTNMNLMFANSSAQMLQTIYCNNDFDLTNAGANVQMFGNNPNLVGGNGTTYDASHTTSEYARLDNPPSAPGYFTVAPDSDITNEEDIELTNEDDEPITT